MEQAAESSLSEQALAQEQAASLLKERRAQKNQWEAVVQVLQGEAELQRPLKRTRWAALLQRYG